jgi:hypothetical protein
MNPQAPKLNAKIKIHKSGATIRPIIENTNAPTHKLAKYIHQSINDYIKLKREYNIINSLQFTENIRKLKLIQIIDYLQCILSISMLTSQSTIHFS